MPQKAQDFGMVYLHICSTIMTYNIDIQQNRVYSNKKLTNFYRNATLTYNTSNKYFKSVKRQGMAQARSRRLIKGYAIDAQGIKNEY